MGLESLVVRGIGSSNDRPTVKGQYLLNGFTGQQLLPGRIYEWRLGFPSEESLNFYNVQDGSNQIVLKKENGGPAFDSCLFLNGLHFCDVQLKYVDVHLAYGLSAARLDLSPKDGHMFLPKVNPQQFAGLDGALNGFASSNGNIYVATYVGVWPKDRRARISVPVDLDPLGRLLQSIPADHFAPKPL